MNQLKTPQAFVRRFDAVRARMLQVQVARAAIRSLMLLIAGLALLAGADYLWELPLVVRQIGLYGLLTGVGVATVYWIASAIARSNRPRTAWEIEEHFPELGQSVRTAVQFGGRSQDAVSGEGVRVKLVEALEERIDIETRPLPLEEIVPSGRLKVALGVAVGLAIVLAALFITDREWNTAARRTLLTNDAYTELAVSPGTAQIEQGHDLAIGIGLTGRKLRDLTLWTRSADASEWQEYKVGDDDLRKHESGSLQYEVVLPKIKEPLAYRVTAGKLASEEFQVTLRYPLHLEKIEVVLTPPAYTRTEPTTVTEGNVQALEGTTGAFRFELDREPVAAAVVLSDPADKLLKDEDEQAPETVPVTIEGNVVTMELELLKDKVYSLQATASDGMKLPENSFRIRVRQDQPPQVAFEQPGEALEVHTLAEVAMRLRARDDFGLTKAGIVFQVNNEEEHTLLAKDFEEAAAEAEKEAADGKRPAPTTQTILEKILPLEHFSLTQRDSVTYYAFAEDNFPGGTRRTESDLRFVDIRPFKRTYKLIDPDDPMGMPGRPLASLAELIARQRFNLNRTLQFARRMAQAANAGGSSADLGTVDNLIEFEQKLATSTRELAEFLEARQVAGNDLLFQAEEAMLAAIDSLSAGKYDNATLQEKDALRYLIEGRNTIQEALFKKPPKVQAEVRSFDRRQTQKLRKPKDEEDTEEVAARLIELAQQEEFVYETLTGLKIDDDKMQGSSGAGSGKPTQKPEKPTDLSQSQSSAAGDDQQQNQDGKDEADKPRPDADQEKSDKEKSDKEKAGKEKSGQQKSSDGKDAAGQKGQGGEGESGETESGESQKPQAPSREELVQKQADIAAEAADIQRVMDKIKNVSDLAKSRIAEAQKKAEQASGALERGDSKGAADEAGKATGMFRELARNVQALGAAETSQKIAMARNVSEEISQSERDFANAVDRQQNEGPTPSESPASKSKSKSPGNQSGEKGEKSKGSGKGQEPGGSDQPGGSGGSEREGNREGNRGTLTERLANRAERIAEAGKTLEDILKSIARSTEPGDQEAVRQVQELMNEGKINEAVKRLEALAPALRAGRGRDASLEARDVADRFEITAQKLETLHRSIVAPRIAELMRVEREAADLKDKLDRLEAQGQITEWHREAEEMLAELEKIDVAEEARAELVEGMHEAGWNSDQLRGNWNWALRGGRYGAPIVYHRSIDGIVEDLHALIQELILGDLRDSADESTPPQYERLVDRYYQVLSSEK